MASTDSLYARLGGYDAIVAVTENLLPRLMQDPQLGRFWANRGEDGINLNPAVGIWIVRRKSSAYLGELCWVRE